MLHSSSAQHPGAASITVHREYDTSADPTKARLRWIVFAHHPSQSRGRYRYLQCAEPADPKLGVTGEERMNGNRERLGDVPWGMVNCWGPETPTGVIWGSGSRWAWLLSIPGGPAPTVDVCSRFKKT